MYQMISEWNMNQGTEKDTEFEKTEIKTLSGPSTVLMYMSGADPRRNM
jgi:hypothetical protein